MICHITPNFRKIRLLILLLAQCCFLNNQKLNAEVSINVINYRYIPGYIFINFSIVNHNSHSIFVFRTYWLDEIKIENDIIKLILEAPWPPEKFYEKNYLPLNLFHIRDDCQEVRSGQTIVLSLLLKIDDELKNDVLIKIYGLRYVNDFNFFDAINRTNNLKEIYDILSENIIYLNYELEQSIDLFDNPLLWP